MYKVTKRDCPMFGIGPYVCEFICDTASDITTLPTSISEGTGGRTAYDNQKCASGSIAIVAENGSESKQYMLNNQDIWCPYSVAAGSSGGSSSGSSITVDFALSNTSENPVANKTITAALNNKADMMHTHSVDEIGADASGSAASALEEAKAYTDSEISDVMVENQRVAKALSTAIGTKANKTDIPTELPANGGNADTVGGIQAVDFRQITKTSIQTLPTPPSSEGDYFVNHGDSSFPYEFGNLSIRYGSYTGEFVAIYQTTGDDRSIWYNLYLGGWVGWERINDGGNADTLDGHHEDYFAKSNNPSIEGNIYLLRSGNATTKGSIFAWEETVRIRNEDPNAENATYTDLIVAPDGIYTESTTNGVIKGRTKIESGKPYVTGSATVAANTNICESNHGFIPSAVIWWNSESSGVAKPLSETQFIMDSVSTYSRAINYMMFK